MAVKNVCFVLFKDPPPPPLRIKPKLSLLQFKGRVRQKCRLFTFCCCSIVFSTHILSMSTQTHGGIPFSHAKYDHSHFNGHFCNANQFNFCCTCVSSVIFSLLWLDFETIFMHTVTMDFFIYNSRIFVKCCQRGAFYVLP